MPFAYYDRLNAARRRIYRRSDGITEIALPDIDALRGYAGSIEAALSAADRDGTEAACWALVSAINAQMKTPPIRVRVLARRPSDDYGELHGLYEPEDGGKIAVISVWMRTAQKEKVVKFRTFLRTLIHEVCHHLDYEHFKLAETFHTEGFYKRESALLNLLLASPATPELPGMEPT
ncbi:MAG: hypothetical protein HY255_12340 [Betaproteobacteria bacterium]|nr:hypothetical protein [Betaproteobacteria bacterium]